MSRPGAGQVGAGDGKIAAFPRPAAVAAGGRKHTVGTSHHVPFSLPGFGACIRPRPECAGRAAGKAESHAREAGIDPAELVNAGWRRTCILCLARSSAPATRQVRRAASVADRGAEVSRRGNHAGAAAPARGRHHRLSAGLAPQAFDGAESRKVTLSFGDFKPEFQGDAYLLSFALPNFYFHVATAYGILRNQGVKIGKLDFLGPYPGLNPA